MGAGDGGNCAAYFDAADAYQSRCGGPPGPWFGLRDRFLKVCQVEISAPGASTDAGLGACASAIKDATPTCGAANAAACNGVADAPGTLPTGAPCGSSAQCGSGVCKAPSLRTCGVCATRIAIGLACDSLKGERCTEDASCVLPIGSPSGTCTRLSDVGGPCGGGESCKKPLNCDRATKKCVPEGTNGAACETNGDCAEPLVCGPGNTCVQPNATGAPCSPGFSRTGCKPKDTSDVGTKTCVAPIPPIAVEPGGACGSGRDCRTGSCYTPTGASQGTCPAVLADGSPCDPKDKSKTCEQFAECVGGTCLLFDARTCK
jgi:hypothetical protein